MRTVGAARLAGRAPRPQGPACWPPPGRRSTWWCTPAAADRRRATPAASGVLAPDRPTCPSWERVRGRRPQGPAGRAGHRRRGRHRRADGRARHRAWTCTASPSGPRPGAATRTARLFAHALGYINEITGRGAERRRRHEGYRPGELASAAPASSGSGSATCAARRGFEKTVVDRRNRPLPGIHVADLVDGPVRRGAGARPQRGPDPRPRRAAGGRARACGTTGAAAAVILEVETGRILAMVSRPGFDPNLHVRAAHRATSRPGCWAIPTAPSGTRPLADTYNPGSTFKVVSAAAALEDERGRPGRPRPSAGARRAGQAALPLHPRPRRGQPARRPWSRAATSSSTSWAAGRA